MATLLTVLVYTNFSHPLGAQNIFFSSCTICQKQIVKQAIWKEIACLSRLQTPSFDVVFISATDIDIIILLDKWSVSLIKKEIFFLSELTCSLCISSCRVSHFSEHVHILKLVDRFSEINFIQSKSCVSSQLCVCMYVCICVSTGFGGLLNHLKDFI